MPSRRSEKLPVEPAAAAHSRRFVVSNQSHSFARRSRVSGNLRIQDVQVGQPVPQMLGRLRTRWLCATVAIWAACLGVAQAQQSRSEVVESQQAEKSREARPYKPGRLEKFINYVDHNDLVERFREGDGFFPWIGGITTGGGLGFGGGYRRHLFGNRGLFEISGARSLRGYTQAIGEFTLPELFAGRLEVGGEVAYRSFPQEDFYGLGLRTVEDERVTFSVEGIDYSGTGVFKPRSWLSAGMRVGYLSVDVGPGTDSRFPSIEQRFTDATAPGLDAQADFVYRELFVDIDSRDEPGNPRSGAHYRAAWLRYDDRDLDLYSFSRFSADASHFFPIFDKKRVFLVRGRLTSSDPDANHVVPFFLKPTLGGSHTLRSVNDFRFRDDHLLLFNAEYRWEAFSGLDMALFADAGRVASNRGDLDLRGLKKAYGFGFRFNTTRGIFYRIDISRGEEGFRFYFKFSGPFKDREQWPADTPAHRHRTSS